MQAALLEKHIGELASGFHLGFAGSKIQEASNPWTLCICLTYKHHPPDPAQALFCNRGSVLLRFVQKAQGRFWNLGVSPPLETL